MLDQEVYGFGTRKYKLLTKGCDKNNANFEKAKNCEPLSSPTTALIVLNTETLFY
jgi:hypothetical protein